MVTSSSQTRVSFASTTRAGQATGLNLGPTEGGSLSTTDQGTCYPSETIVCLGLPHANSAASQLHCPSRARRGGPDFAQGLILGWGSVPQLSTHAAAALVPRRHALHTDRQLLDKCVSV
jgi:hypothetical protein